MKTTELIIAVVYMAVCIGIALYFRKRAGMDAASYWGANRSIGFFVNGIAQFSALLSAASFLGFLGLTYRMGWSFTTITFGAGPSLGFVIAMLLVSGPLRKYSEDRGKFTLTSYLSERYSSASGLATSLIVLILFPAYIIPQLMGAGLVGSYVLGVDFRSAVVLVGSVYVGYVLLGGMLSVTWTDFMQGILMFVFMVGLSVFAIFHFGGVSSLLGKALAVNPYFLSLNPKISPWTYFGLSLGAALWVVASPHLIMRHFTVKDVNEGKASLLLTSGISLVFHLLGYLGVAAAALVLFPKLENIDNTYIMVMNELFSPVIRGLAVAGIIAAIMSTTDAILLALGAEFSNNIYKKYINPEATDHQSIRMAQFIMLAIGAVTIALALVQTKTIGVIVALLIGGMGSSLAVPLVAGIWWKRANKVGAFLSIVGGFAAYAMTFFMRLTPKFGEILIGLPVSLLFMVIGSLVSAPPDDETRRFFDSLHE